MKINTIKIAGALLAAFTLAAPTALACSKKPACEKVEDAFKAYANQNNLQLSQSQISTLSDLVTTNNNLNNTADWENDNNVRNNVANDIANTLGVDVENNPQIITDISNSMSNPSSAAINSQYEEKHKMFESFGLSLSKTNVDRFGDTSGMGETHEVKTRNKKVAIGLTGIDVDISTHEVTINPVIQARKEVSAVADKMIDPKAQQTYREVAALAAAFDSAEYASRNVADGKGAEGSGLLLAMAAITNADDNRTYKTPAMNAALKVDVNQTAPKTPGAALLEKLGPQDKKEGAEKKKPIIDVISPSGMR